MERLNLEMCSLVAETQSNLFSECLFGKSIEPYVINLKKIPINSNLAEKINAFCVEKNISTIKAKQEFFGEVYYTVRNILSNSTFNLPIDKVIVVSNLLDIEIATIVDWKEVNLKPNLILPKYSRIFQSCPNLILDRYFNLKFRPTTSTPKRFLKYIENNGLSVNGQKDVDRKIRSIIELHS
jgi:hypothetical protein